MKVSEVLGACYAAWKPSAKLTGSQWADKYAKLSAESSHITGDWKTLPYQREPLDCMTDTVHEQVTMMKSARVGYTKLLNIVIGFNIDQDPCSMMMVLPTKEDAEGHSKEEIAPMIRDTPILKGKISESKAKDGENTLLHKMFPGGLLSLVGANSPRGFRRVSRRVVIFDEVDGYPLSAGAEGDPIKLGIKRTDYYWNRKIIAGSTPTDADISRIDKLFKAGDQRRRYLPCPHCAGMQYLKWGGKGCHYGIKWPEGEPHKAYYECEHCHTAIEHKWLRWMDERGVWLATNPTIGRHASFHIWAAYSYSPNATWGHLAIEWLECKGDPLLLKTFINTALGEVWQDSYAATVGADALAERAEDYAQLTVPLRALLVVAGIDVQANRVECTLTGYGRDDEDWTIDHVVILGDPERPELWAQVDNLLDSPLTHESGQDIHITAASVDTGDGNTTHAVYNWVRRRAALKAQGRAKCSVIAIKGSSQAGKAILGKPTKQDVNWKGQIIKKGVELYMVGTDTAKSTIYNRLKLQPPEEWDGGPVAGMMHFPIGLPKEYYEGLTCEKKKSRYVNGFLKTEWVKPSNARNEPLDCKVYCIAALEWVKMRTNRATMWQQLERRLVPDVSKNESATPSTADPTPRRQALQPRRRNSWVKG